MLTLMTIEFDDIETEKPEAMPLCGVTFKRENGHVESPFSPLIGNMEFFKMKGFDL